jgi:hypothetical protein
LKPVDAAADLLRLGERSGSDLASALRELSVRGPDATELASLATRLSLQGIAMTAPSTATTASAAGVPAARGAGWKLALAGTVAISGVGLWLLLRAPTAPSAPQAAPTPTRAPVANAAQSGGISAGRLALGASAGAAAAAPLAPPALGATTASPSSTPASSASPQASPPAVQAREATPTLSQPAEPLSHHEGQVRSTSSPAQRSAVSGATTASGAEAAATDAALPSELELLRGARLALKGSPVEALRLVEQHRASYPGGKLTQERELIAISALLALGRRTAALSRAASFERAFPASPYRKQIGELLQ